MEIHPDVVNELININFLQNERKTSIPITLLKTLKDAEKSMNSMKWENFSLDKKGDFTAYLFNYEKEIYKNWNDLVDDAKEKITPYIDLKLTKLVDGEKIAQSMLAQVKFDIMGLAIYLTIKIECPQVNSSYYNDLYALYKAGYIPCGYAKGSYKVL